MKKEKLFITCYECKKCNKYLYFKSNEIHPNTCESCGSELFFCFTNPYNPQKNIKMANTMNKCTTRKARYNSSISPTVICPYCKSDKTEKISGFSKAIDAAFGGVFALPRISKEFHCNNCGADF